MKFKIAAGIILLLGVGALVAMQLINNGVVEYYSPGFVSESIAEARTREVFISRPALKSNVVRWRKSEYSIREAWIEQATRIKYDWIFFRRVIPTGYRLILTIGKTGKPPGEDFMYLGGGGESIVCNDSIWLTSTSPGRPAPDEVLMELEFSSPVPDSIQCVVKKPN